MKTNIFSIMVFSVCIIISGCTKDETKTQPIDGKLISHTDCKIFLSKSTDTGNDESCVEYSFDETNNSLILKHINTGFNCCPDGLYCEIEFTNDTIFIKESENAALCNCLCLFDMNSEITGIGSGQYYLKFIEPYCGSQDKLEFTVDLKQNPSGSYCVERTQYPWGISK